MNTLLAVAAAALATAMPEHAHDQPPQLGSVSFESTCSRPAHAHLEAGLRWLHSFEYQEAERSFSRAAALDADCPIANWGVAMSNYHPLWAAPTPGEFAKGKSAIEKATKEGAKSQRERDYIAALRIFYHDSERLDHKTRALAYAAAAEQLHSDYPQDNEAALFHALSLIAVGTMDKDAAYSKERQAAAILNRVMAANPDHPGVTHYLIHSFDYPPLAELALPAARRYAKIAPDSAHAQHMPSHIFTRLGLWDEAISSNRAAEEAARAHATSMGMAGAWDQRLHAMDYLTYAYLQTGRDDEALKVFDELKLISQADPPSPTVAYAVTAIPARVLLERRQWTEAAAFDLPASLSRLAALSNHQWAIANVHFAKAVGAARAGKLDVARIALAELAAIEQRLTIAPGEYDWRTQVSIERQIADAWIAYANGNKEEAARLMRAAANLDDATEKHPVTPGAILPAREQLGELLLELGRPADALAEYEASLKRAPRRLIGLWGAAQAAKLSGDTKKAGAYYAELAKMTDASDGRRPEVRDARVFASSLAQVQH